MLQGLLLSHILYYREVPILFVVLLDSLVSLHHQPFGIADLFFLAVGTADAGEQLRAEDGLAWGEFALQLGCDQLAHHWL